MTNELLNGWIDGSVEPEHGCEAVIIAVAPYQKVGVGNPIYNRAFCYYSRGFWIDQENGRKYAANTVYAYLPIPPHNKMMTTGSTVLEASDD
jgi:hypothetical protein